MPTKTKLEYDAIGLTRVLFGVFLEKEEAMEVIVTKNKKMALYNYWNSLKDEEIIELVYKLAEDKGYNEITFLDFIGDFSHITSLILQSEGFYKEYLSRVTNVDYPFIEDKGVCGILLKDGKFLKCYVYEHSMRCQYLDKEDLDFAIYFSSRMNFGKWGDSVFRFDLNNRENIISKKQREWFDEHYKYFDKGQKQFADIYVYNSREKRR